MGNNASGSPEGLNLSNKEIELAKTTWNVLAKLELADLGAGLMTRIIIEHKDYKSLWRKRTTDDGEPINHNQVVRAHGEKVFETIKLAMTSIDDLKGLSQTLSQMGYEHYKLGVRSEHYQVLGEALISTISDALKPDFGDSARKVWIKIFAIIEGQMKIGANRAESGS